MEKFDPETMEAVVDYGEITVPEKWEDVTLGMFSEYMRVTAPQDEDKKEYVDLDAVTLLNVFCGIPREKAEVMPVEVVEAILSRMTFVEEPPLQQQPRNYIMDGDRKMFVNFYDAMKVKEWEDVQSVIRNDPYNYAAMLAILCRRRTLIETDHVTGLVREKNEEYTSEFANELFDARKEWFSKRPVTEVMPLLSFFLLRFAAYSEYSAASLEALKEQVGLYARSIEDSVNSMELPRFSRKALTRRLRKLRKRLDAI